MNDTPKPRSGRFSLRTLILLVTICSALFGWMGSYHRRAKQREAIVDSIYKSGGGVSYDYRYDKNRGINPQPYGPSWLRSLLGEYYFCEVYRVEYGLGSRPLTDSEVSQLGELRQLKHLDLTEKGIDDSKLANLRELTELEYLSLQWNKGITDAGLVHLGGMKDLKILNLRSTSIDGSGLAHLDGVSKLEELALMQTNCNDAGLSHLHAMTQLKTLYLLETKITDAGLVYLKPLKNLETLHLQETEVTDKRFGPPSILR